jgi:hypothetical protein
MNCEPNISVERLGCTPNIDVERLCGDIGDEYTFLVDGDDNFLVDDEGKYLVVEG